MKNTEQQNTQKSKRPFILMLFCYLIMLGGILAIVDEILYRIPGLATYVSVGVPPAEYAFIPSSINIILCIYQIIYCSLILKMKKIGFYLFIPDAIFVFIDSFILNYFRVNSHFDFLGAFILITFFIAFYYRKRMT